MYPEELPNGKYKWTLDFKDPLTNKRKRISITLDSKSKKAEKQARAILEARKEEILLENKDSKYLTFHEFYQEFLNDWSKNVKESTIKVWEYDMKQFLSLIPDDALLTKINRRFLQSIFDKLEKAGLSPLFLNRILIRTKQIFRKAVEYEYISKNPATHISIKKVDQQIKKNKVSYLEKDTVKNIVIELQTMDQHTIANLIMILYLTGMRIGEALALTLDDIDFSTHTISISKTWSEVSQTISKPKTEKSIRTINTSKTIDQILQKQIEQSQTKSTLFMTKRGSQMTVHTVNHHIKKACKNIDVPPVTSHIFRHSHISMLAELGTPIKAIMDRVGHSDSSTTLKIYSHVTEKMTNELVNKIENNYATFMPLY